MVQKKKCSRLLQTVIKILAVDVAVHIFCSARQRNKFALRLIVYAEGVKIYERPPPPTKMCANTRTF